ncbi:uncharacterized protein LOC144124765 [Amblyomma americanum]
MKVFPFLALLAVATSACAATVGRLDESDHTTLKEVLTSAKTAALLKETGHTMENIGKILQGQLSQISLEDREKVLNVLQTLSMSAVGDESEDYFIKTIIASIVSFGISKGISAAMG